MGRLQKATLWTAGVAAVSLLALTGYSALSGDGDEAGKGGDKPAASQGPGKDKDTYEPPAEWDEPGQWASLPRGERRDKHGNEVGFPHTPEGAVAQMLAANSTSASRGRSMAEEQMGVYDSYVSAADKSAANRKKVQAGAVAAEEGMRKQLGIAADGQMPPGSYARTHPIGFQIIKQSKNEVSAYALSRVTLKAGETEKEQGSYSRQLMAARWEKGDWKLSTEATISATQQTKGQAAPQIAAPGDAAFTKAGWTAIREAS
ncbi:hypothetical protein [Streptomyces sp. NPDC088360]|uniref:hypothetical protein n=1 Tax=Streptomyces sp. NPDC088360 TaxID=3154515 RepID=UPI00344D635D